MGGEASRTRATRRRRGLRDGCRPVKGRATAGGLPGCMPPEPGGSLDTEDAMKGTTFVMALACTLAGFGLAADRAAADGGEEGLDRGERIEERLDRRGDRVDRRLDRRGDRVDRHLDRRGDRVDGRLDRRAERAEEAGRDPLARRLDRRGDRIEERLDRRGDRAERHLDRRGDRVDRRLDRRGDRAERRFDRR
jgi:hypothetical protein